MAKGGLSAGVWTMVVLQWVPAAGCHRSIRMGSGHYAEHENGDRSQKGSRSRSEN